VSPAATTAYTLTATGNDGTQVTSSVTVTVGGGPPQIINFQATPAQVSSGGQSNLVWNVVNATKVSISPTVGDVGLTGTSPVKPTATTTYTLTASNPQGTVTATAVVAVTGNGPQCDAGPNQVTYNNTIQLNGSHTFSPSGSPLTVLFTFISGPATATITGANTLTPTVSMPQNGEYIFQMTASDASGSCTAFTRVKFVDP
jgi:hypothetical protein